MKKFLVALLALAMMFALAVPVFAEGVSSDALHGKASEDITAEYVDAKEMPIETVYHVTIEWSKGGNLTFTKGSTTYTWDAENTKYTASTEDDGWNGEATVAITVTNRSNAAITATAEWTNAGDINATCRFTGSGNTIASAADATNIKGGDLVGEAVEGKINGTVTVTSGSISNENNKVGTVTLTIEKVA